MKTEEVITGWLSPTGEFIKCSPYEHVFVAEKIASELGVTESYRNDQDIMEHGWININILTFFEHGIMFNYIKEPITNGQKVFLLKFYDEHKDFICKSGFKALYYMGIIDEEELKER